MEARSKLCIKNRDVRVGSVPAHYKYLVCANWSDYMIASHEVVAYADSVECTFPASDKLWTVSNLYTVK